MQFWYEFRDAGEAGKGREVWKRCYGIEHWTFDENGMMRKRMMSGNDVILEEDERWFMDGVDVNDVTIPELRR